MTEHRYQPVLPCVQHTGVSADTLVQPTSPGLPKPQDPDSRRLAVALAVISASQLMVVLDATIVTVALPAIRTALHFSSVNLEWTISAYTLVFGGFLLLGGRLGDVFGRRRMFIVGLVIFTLASFAGGLATTSAWLITTRACQGLGGAITAPTALALIGETFPDGPARTRAMGIYAAMSGAGGAVGLLLGGILTSALSWRWVLFVNVPIGVLVAIAAPRVLARSDRQAGTRLDIPGSAAATAGMTALVYGLVRAPVDGWGDPLTYASFAAAFVLLAAFVVIETRSDHPTLPFELLKDRNRSASYIIMFTLAGSIFAVFYFLTLYLQTDEGYSPLKAGLAFLPFSVGIAATSQVVSKLMRRIPPRIFVTIGPLLGSLGLFWLSRLDDHSGYVSGVLGPITVIAIGIGLTFVPLVLGVTAGVQPAELGIASAVLNTAQQVGGTLGLAILVTIAADATKNAVHAAPASETPQQIRELALAASLHGYTTAFVVGACIALAAFAVALVAARPPAPSAPAAPPASAASSLFARGWRYWNASLMPSLPVTFAEDVINLPARAQFEAFIDEHRSALNRCLDGLTEEQARRSLVPSRTTLLGLVKHAAFLEKVWFDEAVTGRSRAEIGIPAISDESFILDDGDTIAAVQQAHREACESSRRATSSLGLDDKVYGYRLGPLPLRWVYLHVLRELAQHCGHADIIREQLLTQ